MTRDEKNKNKQKEIENELDKEKRKKRLSFWIKFSIFIIIFLILFLFYNCYIATTKIIVREDRVVSSKLPTNFDGIKIVQFSDLHYGTSVSLEELKSLVKLINSRNPDIVVFTGDLIHKNYTLDSKEQEKITNQLKKINASIGKYAIMGDEDTTNFTTIFNQSEFVILDNDYDLIYKDNNNPILIVGIGSLLRENIDVTKAFEYFSQTTYNSNIYVIALFHEPDTADSIRDFPVDLMLAGHSHNGYITIPGLGAFIKKEGAKKYSQRFYKLDNSRLYISSGIGTDGLGIRILCHPSIQLLRLSSK